jgi:hypothetical protein
VIGPRTYPRRLARNRAVSITNALAPIATASVGYIPIRDYDWVFGFEFREQFAYYSAGIQRDCAVMYVAQLSD